MGLPPRYASTASTRRWSSWPAGRSSLPKIEVTCRSTARSETMSSAAIEVTAYFTVAEALTNVARYADATRVEVDVIRDDGRLVVEIRDDGRGGADAGGGSGLRGLADRLSALDGRLDVHSPPGKGTTIRAEIPCAS